MLITVQVIPLLITAGLCFGSSLEFFLSCCCWTSGLREVFDMDISYELDIL